MLLEAKQHIVSRKSGRNFESLWDCPSIENARIISDNAVYAPADQLVSNVETIHLWYEWNHQSRRMNKPTYRPGHNDQTNFMSSVDHVPCREWYVTRLWWISSGAVEVVCIGRQDVCFDGFCGIDNLGAECCPRKVFQPYSSEPRRCPAIVNYERVPTTWFSGNATISIPCTNSYIRAEVGNLLSKAYSLSEKRLYSKFSHVSHLHCHKAPPIKALVLNTFEHAFQIGRRTCILWFEKDYNRLRRTRHVAWSQTLPHFG